jgi:hypothetical protein
MTRRKRHQERRHVAGEADALPSVLPTPGGSRDEVAPAPDESASAEKTQPKAPFGLGRGLVEVARSVQAEDLALFLWIVLFEKVLESHFGADLRAVASLGSAPRWLYAVVFGGLIAVFYTRGPADVDLNAATSRRCVLGLSGWFVARSYFAGDADWSSKALAVGFVVTILIAPLNALERLPRTGLGLRRTLVLPAQLVGNSVFTGMITPAFLRGAELGGVAPEYRGFASVVLSAFLFLYVVVAPRAMAGDPWRPVSWIVRLGLYLSALHLGRPSWFGVVR